MGFNPFREHERSAADIGMVVGTVVVTLIAVAWGIFG